MGIKPTDRFQDVISIPSDTEDTQTYLDADTLRV
jgi:hypothetical protein